MQPPPDAIAFGVSQFPGRLKGEFLCQRRRRFAIRGRRRCSLVSHALKAVQIRPRRLSRLIHGLHNDHVLCLTCTRGRTLISVAITSHLERAQLCHGRLTPRDIAPGFVNWRKGCYSCWEVKRNLARRQVEPCPIICDPCREVELTNLLCIQTCQTGQAY